MIDCLLVIPSSHHLLAACLLAAKRDQCNHQDDFQSPFLTTADFIKTGLPLTLLSLLGISTVAASLIHVFVGGSWGDAD